jgi:hypothetical protein
MKTTWTVSVLLVIAVLALLLRTVAIAQPLGIDQGLWASAAWGMEHGQRLYADVWEQRPPGIYFVYLTAFRLLGWTPATVVWVDVAAAFITTGLLWALTRRLAGPLQAAIVAALYATLTMPSWLFGNGGFLERSISETFIIICVATMAWAAARYRDTSAVRDLVVLGVAAGTTLVFKPNAGLYFPPLLVWALWRQRAGWIWFRPAVAATLAAAVVPAWTLLWLWRGDLLADAKVAVVDFNRFYVGQGFTFAGYFETFFRQAIGLRVKSDPVWLAGSLATLAALVTLAARRALPPLAVVALLWGAGAAAVIMVNGVRVFNSYFLQAYPPLVLITVAMGAAWGRERSWRRGAVAMVLILMGAQLIGRDYVGRVWRSTAADAGQLLGTGDRIAYLERDGNYLNPTGRGYSGRANEELFLYLKERVTPGEPIYLFGVNAAHVYFETKTLPAHRFLRLNFYVPSLFPDPDFSLGAVARDLTLAQPRYLVFENLHNSPAVGELSQRLPEAPELAELMRHYTRDAVIEDFSVYRRVQ